MKKSERGGRESKMMGKKRGKGMYVPGSPKMTTEDTLDMVAAGN